MEAFHAAFRTLGYALCDDGALEAGYEKIALYAKQAGATLKPTHAARQLGDGQWTSKVGDFEDIKHVTLESLHGPQYGEVVQYMRRRLLGRGYVQ